MSDTAPIVLELAPLPREQIGPFLLLGVPKDAAPEQIEAAWAERVKASRRTQIRLPLEDINWAREILNDSERRFRSASATLNLDTAAGVLHGLIQTCGQNGSPTWAPVDSEKPLADWTPPIPVPDPAAVARTIPLPELPLELPAVAVLLGQFLPGTLDPWAPELSAVDDHPSDAPDTPS